jgi:SAM-dependent methyltransferase
MSIDAPVAPAPVAAPAAATLAEWFDTPLGRYVHAREQDYFDHAVADVFGYNAIQVGLPRLEYLRASRISHRCSLGLEPGVQVRADARDLPLATGSADLILLPHVLEFDPHPHQILREVARALMPEGHVMIAAFNPWSLWGLRRAFGGRAQAPWNGRFINLPRIKDWLALLGLEIVAGQMACYAPPSREDQWRERFAFMEKAGDRWWPIAGGVFFLQAVKRVRGLRLIMPAWSDRVAAKKPLTATVPEKVGTKEPMVARGSDRAS